MDTDALQNILNRINRHICQTLGHEEAKHKTLLHVSKFITTPRCFGDTNTAHIFQTPYPTAESHNRQPLTLADRQGDISIYSGNVIADKADRIGRGQAIGH